MNVLQKNAKSTLMLLRFAPFVALGTLMFSLNSMIELPDLLRGYITLLEVQAGLLVAYFVARKYLRLGK
ncbi:MAG: hypothetical protein MUF49_11735 [Oculatellaceae cyanobacterium Prado106]|jgi:hypothetical protein|nr:hypothetical protein [Oculatellaceae cyanobacterium Prado106]